MKLVYLCNEYPPEPHGGIGTFVQAIAHGMKNAGHRVWVAGLGEHPGERDDAGVRVVTLPRGRTRNVSWWLDRLRLCRWLEQQAARGQADLVEAPEYQGPLLTRPGRLPVVLRLHLSATTVAGHAGRPVRRSVRFCEARCLSLFRSWIPVSHYALALTEKTFGLRPAASRVIYSPIAPAAEEAPALPDLPPRFVLFAGGTVSRRKGAETLAEAARIFLPDQPDLHLVYIGPIAAEEGVPADRRIFDIVGPGLAPRVHFCGRMSRSALLACMRSAAVFAYPSTLETFGLVMAEAMLQGCPVVACDCGPCPEFIESGTTGLLVPPHAPRDLAAAVQHLLQDPSEAARLARAGQRSVQARFTLERCVEETTAFYEQCLTATRTSPRMAG